MSSLDRIDFIHVDVEREKVGNTIVITYFDLAKGMSQRQKITNVSFENAVPRLAKTIVNASPVQVIFESHGVGQALRDLTMKELADYNNVVEVKTNGLVYRTDTPTKRGF